MYMRAPKLMLIPGGWPGRVDLWGLGGPFYRKNRPKINQMLEFGLCYVAILIQKKDQCASSVHVTMVE